MNETHVIRMDDQDVWNDVNGWVMWIILMLSNFMNLFRLLQKSTRVFEQERFLFLSKLKQKGVFQIDFQDRLHFLEVLVLL